ncbi:MULTISPECIES: LamG-like jellyroll fold domain-containing protein [unclassified Streptomyces]|uniref:LamG-like jellyroll fold domain-containing protein n=1 Tax=unclassified Streptomyces TaxID=2593676 RepID=UPI001D054E30|nr:MULTISPECIES: LamG-like jellyroll fold domain-containing protein [unclassified Streptomyces]
MRATAVTTLISLSLLLSTEQAMANGVSLPPLSMPKMSLSGVWEWLNTKPLDTPDQEGGTARGKSHKASADDTSAEGGVGRKPGKGKGELDPFERPVDGVEKATTGKAPGDADSFDPKTSKRDAKKSTETSDFFVNADGSTTIKHYSGPANFKAEDGSWKPIDTRLVEESDGRLSQRANSLDVEFAGDAADQQLASVDFGDGRSLAYSLRGTAKAEPVVDEQKIVTYPSVLPDTDLRLVPLAEGFKELLVLHSPDAPNSWLFPLELKGLTPRVTDAGDVEFTDGEGKVAARIPHAFMEDAKIDPRSGDATRSQAVSYELVEEGGKPALRMTADEEWLKDPERVYPVTVDPTVTTSNSTYVQSNYSADRSTENQIKVGSYDSGTNKANSFLQFSSLGTTLKGQRVTSAKLNVYASWSSTCTATVFYAHPVTQSWSPSTTTTYPGPSRGAAIGSATVNPGASCTNTSASTSVGVKMPVTLDTGWFDWVATGGANYGLALTAPTNDGLHWKKFHSDNATTSGFRPALELTYSANTKPQVTAQYPPVNFQANTLQPELLVYASDADKWPSALSYTFEVYDADSSSTTPVATSGALTRGAWKIPSGKLKWSKNYAWYVAVSDGYEEVVHSSRFTTAVPQPPITSGLAQNTDGHEFDPSDGNYTTEDTDAEVSVVGPSLEIDRSYNSLDPRIDNAFGAGWSTVVDMKAAEFKDPSGTVTHVEITYPGGEQVAFGRNSDGTFVPPLGRYARLQAVTGGYTLTDKDFTEYRFTQAVSGKAGTYAISAIKDYSGRTETFAYTSGKLTKITNEVSKRSLTLTWSTPAGATAAHVATVTTDPATAGDAATAQTWTYGYAADQLTKVCTPADPLKCTTYGYTTGNHYRTTVLDADPFAYWRLGEAAGATVAKDSVDINQGKYNGLYHDVTLGSAGPLAGSTQKAAAFNGTSSYVEMPSAPGATPSYMSVSLWFKTTDAGGVLFYYGDKPLSGTDPVNNTTKNTPAVYVGTDGKLRGCLAMSPSCSPNIVSTQTVTDGKWHQAVLTGQANSQTLYLDGTVVGSLTGMINDWNQPYISLGAGVNNQGWPAMDPNDKLGHYTGELAEVAIYSEPLTPAVITAQYKAAKNPAGLLNKITTPEGKVRASVVYGTTDDQVLEATDGDGGTWKLHTPTITGSSEVYRSAVMGSAPTGYWRLDDTGGAPQAANEVNTGFGTYNTVTQGVTGPFGTGDATAVSFNGTSSYAEVPFTPWHGSSERAVELWFKTGSPGVILSDQSQPPTGATPTGSWNPLLYVGADGKLHGHWWSVSGSGSTAFGSAKTVNDNKWHHAVLSASGTKQTLYLDGVKQGEYSGEAKDQVNTRTFLGAGFGKYWYQSPGDVSFFNGSIAEFAAYGHPLSAEQVEAHWKAYKASSGVAPVKTVKLTDPGNKTLTYMYDAEMGNRLLAAIDTNGKRTTYGYDTGGFLHTVTDANGNRSINGHDVRGNTVSTTTCQDTAADKCSTEYYTYYPDATTAFPPMDLRNDLLLTERDGRSSGPTDDRYLTSYTYDTSGQLTSVTTPPVAGHPNGRTATTTYTTASTPAAEGGTATAPAGLLDTVTTAGGKKTRHVYYANGDLAEVIDANGAKVTYTYDNLGRQVSKKEVSDATPDGLTTTYTYDKNDQIVTETGEKVTNRVTGAVHQARTTTGYDADGNILSQTVSDLTGGDAARTTSMTYDAYNRMASRTDPGGDTTSFEYDGYGNKVKETDPDGSVMTFTYDGEGRPLTTNLLDFVGDPNNPSAPTTLVTESRAYDPAGRLASITDAMGWVTEYTYTDDGLSASVVRKDPANNKSFTEQANTYDAAGNLIKQVTNDGRTTTTFTVDASDRVVSSILDPNGLRHTTSVSYDPDDNVVTESEYDPATGDRSTVDRLYDNLGNITGTTVHDGTVAPVARYKLDETTGYSVGDSSGANHTATHGTGFHWHSDRGGSAAFDGNAESYAQTDGPVVNTSGSFTVSTWAKISDKTIDHGLVSQNSQNVYGFVLYYSRGSGWTFLRRVADSTSASYVKASSGTAAVTANTWTHLTGVYDAEAAMLRLYVNGTLAQETPFTTPWEATGALQLGRWQIGTGYDGEFTGGLDDVQVYGEALTAAQVSAVKGGTLPAPGSSVRSATWKLDQRGLPVSATDANGYTTDYGYDEGGQQSTVTEPAVQAEQEGGAPVTVRPVTMMGYNTFGEQTEVSDPLGNVTVTAYDAEGQESSVTMPNYTPPGSTTPITATAWTEYNSLGQVTAEVDPLGNRTTYTYTQLGAVASVTEPGGGTTKYTYSRSGDQLSATRPNGARQEMTWDYLGRQLTDTTIVRQPTQRAYTAINEYDAPGGELSRSVSPTGVAESYTYDVLGEMTELTDSAGQVTKFVYNMDGEVTKTIEPDGTSSTVEYDGFGLPVSTSDLAADGTVIRTARATFDRAGNPVSSTDYRGHTTTFTLDPTGLVTKAVQPVSATESITTTFGYDAAGNRTRFTDGRGNTFLTTYNTWGMPEKLIEPSTPSHPDLADRTFTTVYDANGRVAEQRAPGNVTVSHVYDAKSRLVRQTGTGAEVETVDHTYTYDSDDRLVAAAGVGDTTNTFSYDDRGLLLSTSGPSGASSFAYNGDGALTSRTDASGTSTFGYDSAGRLKTVDDGATGASMTYGYDVNSNVTSIDYGAGKAKRSFGYDALKRLTSDKLTAPSGTVLSQITYAFDANGNETSKTTAGVIGASTNTYTYDWANRITSWNNGTATEVYGYDASGNRTRVGGDTYTYDARNRLTSDGHNTYGYTARGTMSSIVDEGGTTTVVKADAFNRVINEGDRTYQYDGFDRVLSASVAGGSGPLYDFQYSGMGNDVASDGSAVYSRNADGSLIGVKTPTSSALYMTDLHTDVVAQFTDSGETLTGSTTYTPFGKVSQTTGMLGNLGYQSGWTDPQTAKVNMAARWYSPETGSFNSRDTANLSPLPASVTGNRYAYADQNPMTMTDPTGHWSIGGFFKKVTKKVKKVAKSAYKKTKKAVKKVAKVVKKAAKKVKRVVKKVVKRAKRAVRKTVRYVKDSVKKVKRYVKRTYKRVKKYAHKVVKKVKKTVRKVAKAAKSVAKKVVKAAKKVGRAVKKAAKATANFVKKHAGTIASVAVGVAVFAGCTALTAGVGAIGCAALAGAAANGVGYMMSDGPKSVGGFLGAVGVGALTGALGGAAGGAVSGAVGRLLANTGGRVAQGAAMGAAGGAAEGAVGYGVTCAASEEGCSAKGAATATAVGAVSGGIFGAAAGRFGPKSKPQPGQSSSNGPGCRVPHSFTGSTGVLMADGSTKPISEVKVGDYVLTAEPGKKEKEKRKVREVIVTTTDRNYVDILVDTKAGPKTIQSTKHHQFYEATRNSWTQAGDLKTGQKLQNADARLTTILALTSYEAQRVTYDLSVEGLHTYHVLAGATPILVHNCGNASPNAADHVQWVREGGDMRAGPRVRPAAQRAYEYESGVTGAHSDVASGRAMVPRLSMPGRNGDVTAKFDGLEGDTLIDRKNGVLPFTSKSMVDEARRQAGTAAYHGLRVMWEVPDAAVLSRAQRWLNDAGVTTIGVRVAPR